MASAIQSLVDKACGFDRAAHEREQAAINGRDADDAWLILRCPGPQRDGRKCAGIQATERQPEDPPTATLVEIQCPECNGGDFDSTVYLDGAGREIDPPPEKQPSASDKRNG